MRPLVAIVTLLLASSATGARAPESRIAVVAFGECKDAALVEAAHNLRVGFAASADTRFLSEEATAAPAGGMPGPSLDELRRVLETGRTEFLNLDSARAEKTLRGALPDIDRLPLGPQRWEMYWETRAWLTRIVQYVGESTRTTEFLLPILRVQEDFQLNRVDFPPSLRERLELTRSILPGLPRFKLAIATKTGKGQVYLNGFAVGAAPFERRVLGGDYQIVVTDGPRRSFVRALSLGSDTSIMVDLDREAPFVAEGGPCYQSGTERDERLRAAAVVATALGADQIVAVRLERLGGEDYIAAALVEVAKGREVREGRIRREGGRLPPLRRLGQFVLTGEGSPEPEKNEALPAEAIAQAEPAPPTRASPTGLDWRRPVAYALWGAALVLGGVSAYEFVHAGELEAEAGSLLTKDGALVSPQAKPRYDQLQTAIPEARNLGTGLAVGAGIAAVGGGAVFIWSIATTRGPQGSQVAATVTLAGNF